jgi:asparagine synthase (glutamine-hydrolysing)
VSALCGLVALDGRPFGPPPLTGAMGVLAPLGRDGGGTWSGAAGRCGVAVGVALCHRTPEDLAERQPAQSEDGALVIVGDLRVDNRSELAGGLGMMDRPDMPDSRIVLAAYERWGDGFLDRLVGDFALAIVDRRRGGVLLARDHLGVRPLVVHERRGVVAFASNALALTEVEGVGRTLDVRRAAEVLALAYASERTFIAGVRWFPPAGAAWIDDRGMRSWRWWRADPHEIEDLGSRAHEHALRSALDAAVAGQLRGLGPAAVATSGGLDSASVAATAALQLAPGPLRTYTCAPPPAWSGPERPGWDANETPLVRDLAARHPNMTPSFVHVAEADDLFDVHEPLWELGSGPALNPFGALMLHRICGRATVDGASILLTGQCGNSFFSADGPEWLAALLRAGRLGQLAREAAGWRRGTGDGWGQTLRALVGPLLPAAIRRHRRIRSGKLSPAQDWFAATALRPEPAAELDLARLLPHLDERRRVDQRRLAMWLVSTLSSQADGLAAMSANWGVEWRDPTADRRVVEVAMRQPEWARRNDATTRAVTRRAMVDRLPGSIAWRTRRGEQVPDWLDLMGRVRRPLSVELDGATEHDLSRELIDVERLAGLLATWPHSARRADLAVARDYQYTLPRALLVSRYLRWLEARLTHRDG